MICTLPAAKDDRNAQIGYKSSNHGKLSLHASACIHCIL